MYRTGFSKHNINLHLKETGGVIEKEFLNF